jgi:hypothetical protein
MSIAMMVFADAILEAIRAASPTAPTPMTAIEVSFWTLRTFKTDPAPVWRPHPRGANVSNGAVGETLTIYRQHIRIWEWVPIVH